LTRCEAQDQTDGASDERAVPESVRLAKFPNRGHVGTREVNRQGVQFEVGEVNGLQGAADAATIRGQDFNSFLDREGDDGGPIRP
jgi:hypothetical protein